MERNVIYLPQKKNNTPWNPQQPSLASDGRDVEVLHKDGTIYRSRWGKLEGWYVWDWIIPNYPQGTWNNIIAWRDI